MNNIINNLEVSNTNVSKKKRKLGILKVGKLVFDLFNFQKIIVIFCLGRGGEFRIP